MTAYCIPLHVPRNGMRFVRTVRSASMTASSSAYGEPGTSQMPSNDVTSKLESVGSQTASTPYSAASRGTRALSSRWLRWPRSSPNSPIDFVTPRAYGVVGNPYRRRSSLDSDSVVR